MKVACKMCGKPALQGRWVVCSETCRALRERLRKRKGKAITSDLGPAKPLNGMTPRKLTRLRNAKVRQALADGVDADGLAERFGLTPDAAAKLASRVRTGEAR